MPKPLPITISIFSVLGYLTDQDAIERQGQESRFCGNEGDVIDVGPEGMNR
jgi:hypothetical protein